MKDRRGFGVGVAALLAAVLFLGAAATGDLGSRSWEGGAKALEAPELPPLVGEERAVLTQAPNVPAPIRRDHATKVVVELETVEVVKRLADGVDYTFWTFGGSAPGTSSGCARGTWWSSG